MPTTGFDRGKRLLNAGDFKSVFDNPRFKLSHRHFLILAVPGTGPCARLGLVIAKKNIRLAVQRNRVKRVVRETFRQSQQQLDSLDIVFLARRGFETLPLTEQSGIMHATWQKLADKVTTS
jgi:ribonuclease P protein component